MRDQLTSESAEGVNAHSLQRFVSARPRVVSLFAGIGGFDLGFDRAGMETVAYVERDDNCRKLLADKFPNAVSLDDVCSAGANNLPQCDVLVGGWPCQDLSVAGKRAGLAGERSGLFYEYARIADELEPAFIVWENVPGLLTSDEGRDMLRVVLELQQRGYCGGWRTLDAQYLGLAQRRRRVIGVFTRANSGAASPVEILSLAEGVRGHPAPRRETGQTVAGTFTARSSAGGGLGSDFECSRGIVCGSVSAKWSKGTGGPAGDECYNLVAHTLRAEGFDSSEDGTGRGTPIIAFSSKDSGADAGDIAPTLRSMNYAESHINGGGQVAVAVGAFKPNQGAKSRSVGFSSDLSPTLEAASGGNNKPAALLGNAVRRLTPRECERLQGFPDDWTAGFSDSVRYRMLGNAVAVPVAHWIGKRLMNALKGTNDKLSHSPEK